MKKKGKTPGRAVSGPKKVYLVAEGTGETISKIGRAALSQFDQDRVQVKRFFQVTSRKQVLKIASAAVKDDALVAFSIVASDLSRFLIEEASRLGIKAIDVIGDFIVQLSMFLGQEPMEVPGRQHTLDEEYYRRIEAINYAVKHDDGKSTEGLAGADLVLIGLSRTGKTPLSTYLAHQGWKVANVPLHPDMDAPEALFQVSPRKVFGLIINVENLVRVREARLKQLGLSGDAKYADPLKITDEIEWCREFYKAHPRWKVVNISDKAIEEMAASILNLYNR